MRSLIYTYFYGGDTKIMVALGNSIRIFSSMESICVILPDTSTTDRKILQGHFSKIEVSANPIAYIVGNESIDRAMIISPGIIVTEKIDILLSLQVPSASPELSIIVIRPNRLISKLPTLGRDVASVKNTYISNGYTWNTLDSIYDTRPSQSNIDVMYKNVYIPVKQNLLSFLKKLLGTIMGEKGSQAVDREAATYILAFTHKSVNPVSNYEMLEAYGDGFLKGAYMWVLSQTPGIVDQDQITKLSDYYGGNEILADIGERLGLIQYIMTNDMIDLKVKGDIVESLIGAIAFSWDRLYGEGSIGVRMFVSHIYSLYTVDVSNYKSIYTSPIQLFNEYVQRLRLDRKKVDESIDREDHRIIYKMLYDGEIVGVGIVPRTNANIQDQIRLAKVEAAKDALVKKSLDRFVRR